MATKTDKWSAETYSAAADFVPKLATTVLSYLSPSPSEHILDIGCGDGQLTAQFASAVGSSGRILGLDASPSFISTATSRHSAPNCSFQEVDCSRMSLCADAVNGSWDKVFSNAALHWILREPSTRRDVFRDVHQALKQGGLFVFEMGGKGNVDEVHAAVLAALVAHGVGIQEARESCPWFFPSADWMREALKEAGFEPEKIEIEYRPTKCTAKSEDGRGGLEGWIRLMAAEMLAVVERSRRDSVVKMACETLETIVTREEDGSQWIGYVRLRAVARKR